MDTIFQISALCITGTLLAVVLKKGNAEFSLFITLAVVVVVFCSIIAPLTEIFDLLKELARYSHVNNSLYVPLYKAIGIAVVVRIGSCLCRDAGESALAVTMELAGTVCMLMVSIPLIRTVLSLLLELIE